MEAKCIDCGIIVYNRAQAAYHEAYTERQSRGLERHRVPWPKKKQRRKA